MTEDRQLIFYHAPHTRAAMTRVLLEELSAPHEVHVLDFPGEEHRKPAFLAINPMGKIPTIVHGGHVITETVAIFIYLADLFPEAKLAPALTIRCADLICAGWSITPPASSPRWRTNP